MPHSNTTASSHSHDGQIPTGEPVPWPFLFSVKGGFCEPVISEAKGAASQSIPRRLGPEVCTAITPHHHSPRQRLLVLLLVPGSMRLPQKEQHAVGHSPWKASRSEPHRIPSVVAASCRLGVGSGDPKARIPGTTKNRRHSSPSRVGPRRDWMASASETCLRPRPSKY